MSDTKTSVIIAAAGSSRRMGGSIPKQYLMIKNLPVLIRTVKAFCDIKGIFEIILSVPSGDEEYAAELLKKYLHVHPEDIFMPEREEKTVLAAEAPAPTMAPEKERIFKIVSGGAQRQDSVEKAVLAADETADFVLVQDGARPFVEKETIEAVIDALKSGAKSVVPAVTPKSTIRTKEETLDRSSLYEVQTPQGFPLQFIKEAFSHAHETSFVGTDDASVAENAGAQTVITPGTYSNIKITTVEDLPKDMRIGTGYDVHRLVEGRKLWIGCVEIPYEKGLLGHSDADVLSHAVADALLGAAALGDIGKHFPDKDPKYEGMSGEKILSLTAEILRNNGFTIGNVDATLVAERPKISPYTELMRERMAAALGIEKSAVSVKATTEEGMGFTGDGSAMSAQAVALIF